MRIDDVAPSALAQAWALLDEEERARADRFRDAGARAQFVAARALLRGAMSACSQQAARPWRFRADARGKPHLDEPKPEFVFNLSHTDGLVACALARGGEIGIDVERIAPTADLLTLARANFSRPEADHVAALDGEARTEAFFAIWTLKEAYAKARGLGLQLDMTAFAFDLSDADAIGFVTDVVDDDASRWRFFRDAPTPDTRLALAAAAPLDIAGVRPRWTELGACLQANA